VILIEPKLFGDSRGFFYESYREDLFAQNGIGARFVQDNQSRSAKGSLRGLHYQISPMEQSKLVRVVSGEVFDVVVDIRPGSKTFGQHYDVLLSAENKKLLYVPDGFAHGFLALKDNTELVYKVSNFYSPDPKVGIDWPKLDVPYLLSEKDKKNPTLEAISR
jgi:dTDP-4-dehydrorhamnose 3,5-epimerase